MKNFTCLKFNSLFVMFLFFLGTIQTSAQIDIPTIDDPTYQRGCTEIVNLTQTCEADGTVTLTFRIANNTFNHVDYIHISDGNGWSQGIPTSLPPFTVNNVIVTYTGAIPGSLLCLTIKLYNAEGICCFRKICIRVRDCPCAEVVIQDITCVPGSPDTYQYCVEIINPASSTNTIDQITFFTDTPDLCLNGVPVPTTISISPIPPGSSGVVCVELSGCNAPLPPGVDVDLTFFLEDTSDPAYCCHVPTTVTTPCCIIDTCAPFDFGIQSWTIPNPRLFNTTIISGVTATITFELNGAGVPDRLIVTVNGVEQLNFIAGDTPCNVGTNPSTNSGTINIVPCDVVDITVFGDICGLTGTAWVLTSSCNGNLQNPPIDQSYLKSLESSQQVASKRLPQNNQESLTIFPNPVRDLLNIRNIDTEMGYESLKIMDSSGRTIITKNLSDKTDLQIDTNSLSPGTYLLEITSNTGNRIVEKFVKLQ